MSHDALNGQLFEGEIKGGTPQLFSTKEMLTDRARYPRGFTPARLRDVQSTTSLDPQWHGDEGAGAVAAVRDNLARSTVPVAHMRGVDWRTESRLTQSDASKGVYHPPADPGASATINLQAGEEHGLTPIHELGHHVSQVHEQTAHSSYDDPVDMGREEAYAENYAEKHFRDRRGRAPRYTQAAAEGWTFDGQRGGRHGGFHDGWNEMRTAGSPTFARAMAYREQYRSRQARIQEQQTLW